MTAYLPDVKPVAAEVAIENLRAATPAFAKPSLWRSLLVLFKFRIVMLLLFSAVGGAFLAAGGLPRAEQLLTLIITGALAASGSSALNQYLERDSDTRMVRTRTRPLPSGALAKPGWVPYVATLMIVLPSLAVLPSNPALAFFLMLGAAIYVGVYTLWLKPRTLLNIVIGGAAGSAAVLSGSAAVGRWNDPGAIVLALLVFLWTPSHFWSLAILYREDYARGGVPMLPVQVGAKHAAWWVLLHTVATALAALTLVVRPALGWIYFVPVAVATADLFARNFRLVAHPTAKNARSLFMASNMYLAVVLLMACIDAVIRV